MKIILIVKNENAPDGLATRGAIIPHTPECRYPGFRNPGFRSVRDASGTSPPANSTKSEGLR